MKRLFPVIIALALLLSACGAAQPAPTPAPTPSPVSTPAATPQPTPETNAASSELSPLCSWALQELDRLRQIDYARDNNVTHIKDTVRLFLYMHYDMFAERECRFPDFSPFLDPNGEGYEKLLYFVAETQYIHLYEGYDEDVQWYNVDLDFESIEVDGNIASVTVSADYDTVRGDGSSGGMTNISFFKLNKLDGVWYLSDMEPDSIYGSDRHGTYEELLEQIAALEGAD